MSDCLLDVVIAIDLSTSTGLPGANSFQGGTIYEGERRLLERIVQSLNSKMQAGEAQVGIVEFADNPDNIIAYTDGFTMTALTTGDLDTIPSSSNPGGLSNLSANMYDCAVTNRPTTWPHTNGGTNIRTAIVCALAGGGCHQFGVINAHGPNPQSSLGDRSGDPDFKKVLIVISGAHDTPPAGNFGWSGNNAWPGLAGTTSASGTTGCLQQSASLTAYSTNFALGGPSNQLVIGVVVGDKDINNTNPSLGGMTQANRDQILSTLDAITCVQNGFLTNNGSPLGFYANANSSNMSTIANAIKSEMCSSIARTYNCSGINGVAPGILPWQCYDPGTGLGTYTAMTALQGGYSSALSECLLGDCRERQATIDDFVLSGIKPKFCKLVELCPCGWDAEMIEPEPGTSAAQNILEKPLGSQCRLDSNNAMPLIQRCIGSNLPIEINDAWAYNGSYTNKNTSANYTWESEKIVGILSEKCEPCNLRLRSEC